MMATDQDQLKPDWDLKNGLFIGIGQLVLVLLFKVLKNKGKLSGV